MQRKGGWERNNLETGSRRRHACLGYEGQMRRGNLLTVIGRSIAMEMPRARRISGVMGMSMRARIAVLVACSGYARGPIDRHAQLLTAAGSSRHGGREPENDGSEHGDPPRSASAPPMHDPALHGPILRRNLSPLLTWTNRRVL